MADNKQPLFTGTGTSDTVQRVVTDTNPDLQARPTSFVSGAKIARTEGLRKILPALPIVDEQQATAHIQDLINATMMSLRSLNQEENITPGEYTARRQNLMTQFNTDVLARTGETGQLFDQEQARGITRIEKLAPNRFTVSDDSDFSVTYLDTFSGRHVNVIDDVNIVREKAVINAAEVMGEGYAFDVFAGAQAGDPKALEIQSQVLGQSYRTSLYKKAAAESVSLVGKVTGEKDAVLAINRPQLNMEYNNNLSVVSTLADQVLQPVAGQVRTQKQILADFDTKLGAMLVDPEFFPTAFALTQAGATDEEMARSRVLFDNYAKGIRSDVEALTQESITEEQAQLINNRIAIRRGAAQLKLDDTTFFALSNGANLNQMAEGLDRIAHLNANNVSDQMQFLIANMQLNDQFVSQISDTSLALAQAGIKGDSEGQINLLQGGVLQTIDAMQEFIRGGNDPSKVRVNADTLNAAYLSFRRHNAFQPAMTGFQTPAGRDATKVFDDTYQLFLNKVTELSPGMRAQLESDTAKQDKSLDINLFRSQVRPGATDNPVIPTTELAGPSLENLRTVLQDVGLEDEQILGVFDRISKSQQ
jgi:hypothetical protein